MLAITNVLTHCTDASYNLLQMHLVWVGDYSLSAINDATLGLAWLWKGPSLMLTPCQMMLPYSPAMPLPVRTSTLARLPSSHKVR